MSEEHHYAANGSSPPPPLLAQPSPQAQGSDSGFSPWEVPSDMELHHLLSSKTFSPHGQPFSPETPGSDSGFSPGGGGVSLNQFLSSVARSHLLPPPQSPPQFQQGYQQHKQGYQEHKQGYQQHKQGYQEHKQGYQQHKQGYQEHKQGYQQHKQGYQEHKQGYQQQQQQQVESGTDSPFPDYGYPLGHFCHQLDRDRGRSPDQDHGGLQTHQMTQLHVPLPQHQASAYCPPPLRHAHASPRGHAPYAYAAPDAQTCPPVASYFPSQSCGRSEAPEEWPHAHAHFPPSPYALVHAEQTQSLYAYPPAREAELVWSQQRCSPLGGASDSQTAASSSPWIAGYSDPLPPHSYTPAPYPSPSHFSPTPREESMDLPQTAPLPHPLLLPSSPPYDSPRSYCSGPAPPPCPASPVLGWGSDRGPGSDGVQQLTTERTAGHGSQMRQTEYQPRPGTPECRLLCSVCQRDFKSLPALNGHMRSHGGQRGQTGTRTHSQRQREEVTPVAMVMHVSVPVSPPAVVRLCQEEARQTDEGRTRPKRRYRRRPPPLLLPQPASPAPSPAARGAPLFQSLLRVAAGNGEVSGSDGAVYTPPPMLRPAREGTGLYCSLTPRGQHRAHRGLLQYSDSVDSSVAKATRPWEAPEQIKPRINVGPCFQAEIPPLQDPRRAQADSHNALHWILRDDLETPPTQRRVEAFLMMACSCVVPGGGVSSEYALHVLSQNRGDFLVTVEKLLLAMPLSPPPSPLTPYHYPGCDRWTSAEKRLVNKALHLYQKDFSRVQKMVQTKTVAQCVEFYYTWKKRLHLNLRTRSELPPALPEGNGLSALCASLDKAGREVADPLLSNDKLSNLRSPQDSLKPTANHVVCCVGGLSNGGGDSGGSSAPAPEEAARPSASHHPGLVSPRSSLPPASHRPQPALLYPCKQCTKVFSKVKSRNAHMKSHRQQDHSPVRTQAST